jgi:S1-C subfamily serine protease
MKYRNRSMRLLAAIVLTLTAGVFGSAGPSALAMDQAVIARVVPTVVQLGPVIIQTTGAGQRSVPFGWGSGTIVASNGYILTNHHVTDLTDAVNHFRGQPGVRVMTGTLAVFLTKQADAPPVPAYLAEVVADSQQYDLAVLHITRDLSGAPVDSSKLNLPALPLGDSDKLKLGQSLAIFGYPGIGGETITFTSGDVSGFTFEAGVSGRAWIKTSASISGGNSGGTAVNDQGELVGLPTQAGSGQAGTPPVDCRPVADTNGDGRIDDKDLCVPIGGFINALRPVNLAKDLVAQATGNINNNPQPTVPAGSPTVQATVPAGSPTAQPTTQILGLNTPTPPVTTTGTTTTGNPTATGTVQAVGTGTPGPAAAGCDGPPAAPGAPPRSHKGCVSGLFFTDGLADVDAQVPGHVVTSLPSGSKSLILFFDYSKFEQGARYLPHIYIDGQEVKDAFQPTAWDLTKSPAAGVYWFGYLDANLKDGTYRYDVEYDNYILGSSTIKIGGPATNDPVISNITFTGGTKVGALLPAGITRVDASFDSANMGSGPQMVVAWSQRSQAGDWTVLGQSASARWTGADKGSITASFTAASPMQAGNYRFQVMLDGKLVASRDFDLAGTTADTTPGVTPPPTPPTTPVVQLTPTTGVTGTVGTTPSPAPPQPSPSGTAPPAPVNSFGPITFASGVDNNDKPVNPGTSFTNISELYSFFNYQGMQNGLEWSDVWYRDGSQIARGDSTWSGGPSGTYYTYLSTKDGGPLKAGTYEVRLLLGGRELQRATAQVSGQPNPNPPSPTPSPAPANQNVYVKGIVTDGFTGRPIPGAIVGVLRPGITWSTFSGNDSELLEYTYTDPTGSFSLPMPLQRGGIYSIGVEAQGYTSLHQDNVQVDPNAAPAINVPISLQPLR